MAKRGMIASATIRKPGPKLSALDVADLELLIERQTQKLLAIG
jgi:4-hydroxy-tetrahydrodipicolinate synthase